MNMSKFRMVYIYGPDGAGKTTHARIAFHTLKKLGVPVVYCNLKFHHMLSYPVLRLLLRPGCSEWYRGFPEPIRGKLRTPLTLLESLSILVAIFFRVVVFWIFGYVLVCERYVIDSLVTLSAFLGNKNILKGWFARAILRTIPQSSLLVQVDATINTLLERKWYEPITPRLAQYYRILYHAYTSYLRMMGFDVIIIDTSNTPINDAAKSYLKKLHILARGARKK